MPDYDILIIGGGAAGFFGALTAAENAPHARIAILERGNHALSKVRISGGGRCNVTHACYDPKQLTTYYPRGSRELFGPFTRFGPGDTVQWFEARGVQLKTEPDGRIFPNTDQSQTIIDCLMQETGRLGIRLHTRFGVKTLQKKDTEFVLSGDFGQLTSSAVLLAPGGGNPTVYQLAAGLGHTIISPVPSLFTFNILDARLEGLAGVSVTDCEATLALKDYARRPITARGALLVTHWGGSGPVVLRLSAWGARALSEAGYRAELYINWLPPHTSETLFSFFLAHKSAHPKASALKFDPKGRIPARLWRRFALHAGILERQCWADIPNRTLRQLAEELTRGVFAIQGKGQFKDEFVTCGGVALKEVNFKTMESRLVPGLYFAGEILDIDGLTGGFNFQSAWTTGWVAGKALAGT